MALWLEIAIGWSVGSAICWVSRTVIGNIVIGFLARRQAKKMHEATEQMEDLLEQRKSALAAQKAASPKRVVGRKVVEDA